MNGHFASTIQRVVGWGRLFRSLFFKSVLLERVGVGVGGGGFPIGSGLRILVAYMCVLRMLEYLIL